MIALVGFLIVIGSVLGGFAMSGGPFAVLLAWSEWVVIVGTAIGTMLVSTPLPVLKAIFSKSLKTLKPSPYGKPLYLDALKLLYELFQSARRDGLVAIESHIEDPKQSAIFKRYPRVLHEHHEVTFLCDSLRLVLVGSVPAFDLESLMDAEIDVHHENEARAVSALSKVADSLPGIGIVAAVLGIVVTMQAVGGPIEEIGHHVASALVGTFLGILLSYGFLAPLAGNIESRDADSTRFYHVLKAAVVAFAKGFPPIVTVEFARRAIMADDRPSFGAMETACKEAVRKEKAA
jgi:chemotaxis protein MotA